MERLKRPFRPGTLFSTGVISLVLAWCILVSQPTGSLTGASEFAGIMTIFGVLMLVFWIAAAIDNKAKHVKYPARKA